MKASDLFVRCLEREGVEYIFGVPGEENVDLLMSLAGSPIRFVVCRHEQGAAFIADAYGRLTGKAGVCLGTLGPGATNLLTGVANANMDRSPLVVITGQGNTRRLHKESHQAMDVVSMFRPVVKWGASISNADAIPEIIRKAFKLAQAEKKGATHVELPEDVAKRRTLQRPLAPSLAPRVEPDEESVRRAAEIITSADFPVILAGNGVLRGQASAILTALAEQSGMPVLNTFMGKGAIPASHPGCLFTVGLQSRDFNLGVLEEADVVLGVGLDMAEYHPRLWNRGRPKQIIDVDFAPAEVDAAYNPTVDLVADIASALRALVSALPKKRLVPAERYAACRHTMEKEFKELASDTSFPVKPQKILYDVRRVLGPDDILLSDVGAHKVWIGRYYQCESPDTCLVSNGFCSMGFALPGAIGAKISRPERRVLAICGDGGFLMNVQELETAVRLKLPLVIMIWNDAEYGLIRWKQEAHFGQAAHIGFTNPDFVKLAEAFGAIGLRVSKTEELPRVLERALAADRPVVIDCPVDYSENLKLSRRLGETPSLERTSLLKRVTIFSGIDSEQLEVIANYAEPRRFDAGATLCRQGETTDDVFFVYQGDADVLVQRNGQAETVGHIGPGDCVGEMAMLSGQPRSATVVAGSGGLEALVVSGEALHEILLNQPVIGVRLLRVLSQRTSAAADSTAQGQ
jgi:acetolactate synthase-1/2/3 large subunit